jgi:hypothetical protein
MWFTISRLLFFVCAWFLSQSSAYAAEQLNALRKAYPNLAISTLVAQQAYEKAVLEFPAGISFRASYEQAELHTRVVVLRDDLQHRYLMGIRGTDLDALIEASKGRDLSKMYRVSTNFRQDFEIAHLVFADAFRKRIKPYKNSVDLLKVAAQVIVPGLVGAVLAHWYDYGALTGAIFGLGVDQCWSLLGQVSPKYFFPQRDRNQHLPRGRLLSAFEEIIKWYGQVKQQAHELGYKVEISGHSSGGFFAAALGMVGDDHVWTFNAPGGAYQFVKANKKFIAEKLTQYLPLGFSSKDFLKQINKKNAKTLKKQVINFTRKSDFIGNFGPHVGTRVILPDVHEVDAEVTKTAMASHNIELIGESFNQLREEHVVTRGIGLMRVLPRLRQWAQRARDATHKAP